MQQTSAATEQFADDFLDGISLSQLDPYQPWQVRYKLIMQWAARLPQQPALRQPQNKVRGCESDVWMVYRQRDGVHQFAVDADSRIIKGLAIVLLLLIKEQPRGALKLESIAAALESLGLASHLSQSRNNGFLALLERALELSVQV